MDSEDDLSVADQGPVITEDAPGFDMLADADSDNQIAVQKSYQVLARQYRPQNFAALLGQEAMVQTLTNAF